MNNVTELNTYANTGFPQGVTEVVAMVGMLLMTTGIPMEEGITEVQEVLILNENPTPDFPDTFTAEDSLAARLFKDLRVHNRLSQMQVQESMEQFVVAATEFLATGKITPTKGVANDSIH